MSGNPSAEEFVRFALQCGVLRFGRFTLKSGRDSPYFFNAGLFHSGARLARLGRFYARAIVDSGVAFDMLFGPAYKGIPLAAATAIALHEQHQRDVSYAFNRKEAKDHAEGGLVVGAPLQGRVLVVDDVISAGLSVADSARLIDQAGARLAGVAICLDRQERGSGNLSAVQEVEQTCAVPVIRIATLDDVMSFLRGQGDRSRELQAMDDYRSRYGIAT